MDSYLERLRRELEHATAGASGSGMTQAPAGKWNAAQILEHLLLTYKGTSAGLAKCLEQGAPLATRDTMKNRIGRVIVLGFEHIPGGRKAPERATPRGMPAEEVRQSILTELEKLNVRLNDCERQFGVRAKIMDHPLLGPFTAEQWRKFHWVHGRHHVRQIRERIGRS